MPASWTKFAFPIREAAGGRLCSKAPNRLSPCQGDFFSVLTLLAAGDRFLSQSGNHRVALSLPEMDP